MQTALAEFIRQTPAGEEADRILRNCVHCGFCTATCPTYQLLGDELDGPRGRIYQIKQVLEGQPANATVRLHLDRCLTCRACETTCPSGVDYHRLLDIGRAEVERQAPRPLQQRAMRRLLVELLAYRRRFGALLRLGQTLRPLLPPRLRAKVPIAQRRHRPATGDFARRVLVLEGCVQPALAPQINAALASVLARLGIGVRATPAAGCCGALPHHLGDTERARRMARANIDAWLPAIDAGAEALLVTASGCAAQVADYPHLLANDPDYADRAGRLAAHLRDPVQLLGGLDADRLRVKPRAVRIAVHTPCTQQHALGLAGKVAALLSKLGYTLTTTRDDHLCCGSAGTYSILNPGLSGQLRERKLAALKVDHPDLIVTANIGCQAHLDTGDPLPVMHWLELVASDLTD